MVQCTGVGIMTVSPSMPTRISAVSASTMPRGKARSKLPGGSSAGLLIQPEVNEQVGFPGGHDPLPALVGEAIRPDRHLTLTRWPGPGLTHSSVRSLG